MQNGRGNTSHRDQTVQVGVDDNWNDGGHPNSVPFYLSTAGYGVFRNTYAPNTYVFGEPVTASAKEQRFDAYYFAGDAKHVIGDYTQLTGKPFMPPVYGLEPGDSDCYLHNANRGERHTLDALKVADAYKTNDMPNGWMLVNDGYGCGYENLPETGARASRTTRCTWACGPRTGSTSSPTRSRRASGSRNSTSPGSATGTSTRSTAARTPTRASRPTATPAASPGPPRAGRARSAAACSGPATSRAAGTTSAGRSRRTRAPAMSGLAYTSGDIDGIFGGSPKTYTRDLQWKSFLPAVMTMDGWAASDKQPYQYGEPYTSINRDYLKLKESLLPYMYSYAHEATKTGVGPVRPLALEYPDDPKAATDAAKYEFLSGEDFLVAPVYQDTAVRNGIYLPKGTWIDYWSGRTYQGPATVDGYSAPLDTLPLFVKAGAAVPMWPGIRSYQDRTATSPLAWDIYPQGRLVLPAVRGRRRDPREPRPAPSPPSASTSMRPRRGAGDVPVQVGASQGRVRGHSRPRAPTS